MDKAMDVKLMLWMALFGVKGKKRWFQKGMFHLHFFEGFCCCHSKVSCSDLSRECKLEKNVTNVNNHFRWHIQESIGLFEISFGIFFLWKLIVLCSNPVKTILFGTRKFKTNKISWNTLQIRIVSLLCHVISIPSIVWTHNALIGLFNPIKLAGCLRSTSCFINIYVFVGVSAVTLDVLWFCLPPCFEVFIASLVPVHLVGTKKYLIKGDTFQSSLIFKWCSKNLLFIT